MTGSRVNSGARRHPLGLAAASARGADDGAEDTIIPIPNGDFENGREHWTFHEGRGTCTVTDARAASGTHLLKIIGDVARRGAKVTGPMVAYRGPA